MELQKDPHFLSITDMDLNYDIFQTQKYSSSCSEIFYSVDKRLPQVQRASLSKVGDTLMLSRGPMVKAAPQIDIYFEQPLPAEIREPKSSIYSSSCIQNDKVAVLIQTPQNKKRGNLLHLVLCPLPAVRIRTKLTQTANYELNRAPLVERGSEENCHFISCVRDKNDCFENGYLRFTENREFIAARTTSKTIKIWKASELIFRSEKNCLSESGVEVSVQTYIKDFCIHIQKPGTFLETVSLAILEIDEDKPHVTFHSFTTSNDKLTPTIHQKDSEPTIYHLNDSGEADLVVSNICYVEVHGNVMLASLSVENEGGKNANLDMDKILDESRGRCLGTIDFYLIKENKLKHFGKEYFDLLKKAEDNQNPGGQVKNADLGVNKFVFVGDFNKQKTAGFGLTMAVQNLGFTTSRIIVFVGGSNFVFYRLDLTVTSSENFTTQEADMTITEPSNILSGNHTQTQAPKSQMEYIWAFQSMSYQLSQLFKREGQNILPEILNESSTKEKPSKLALPSRMYPLYLERNEKAGAEDVHSLKAIGFADQAKGKSLAIFFKDRED